jgi:hypothetical protein
MSNGTSNEPLLLPLTDHDSTNSSDKDRNHGKELSHISTQRLFDIIIKFTRMHPMDLLLVVSTLISNLIFIAVNIQLIEQMAWIIISLSFEIIFFIMLIYDLGTNLDWYKFAICTCCNMIVGLSAAISVQFKTNKIQYYRDVELISQVFINYFVFICLCSSVLSKMLVKYTRVTHQVDQMKEDLLHHRNEALFVVQVRKKLNVECKVICIILVQFFTVAAILMYMYHDQSYSPMMLIMHVENTLVLVISLLIASLMNMEIEKSATRSIILRENLSPVDKVLSVIKLDIFQGFIISTFSILYGYLG